MGVGEGGAGVWGNVDHCPHNALQRGKEVVADSPQCSESSREWISCPHRWPVERPRLRLVSPAGGLALLGGHCQESGAQVTGMPWECSQHLITAHVIAAAHQSSVQKEPGVLRPSEAMSIEPPKWPLTTLGGFFQKAWGSGWLPNVHCRPENPGWHGEKR